AWMELPAAEVRTGAAQHRRVTLMQTGCDLFESASLLEALDPEEQHDLLAEFQHLCRDVVARFGGTEVKATDRGLLVCFGFPVALEAPARRAVTAGLELLGGMASLNERLGRLRLSARVAVHSDLAVVTQAGQAPLVVGQVLTVVDQLERQGAPDTVVI